jgi:hypothetical protein
MGNSRQARAVFGVVCRMQPAKLIEFSDGAGGVARRFAAPDTLAEWRQVDLLGGVARRFAAPDTAGIHA